MVKPLDYSGHQPESTEERQQAQIDAVRNGAPAAFPGQDVHNEVRGFGLRAEDFQPVVNVNVRQSRDKAQYTREQKGHSLTLWILLGGLVLWIPAIYYTFSPRHFWHA